MSSSPFSKDLPVRKYPTIPSHKDTVPNMKAIKKPSKSVSGEQTEIPEVRVITQRKSKMRKEDAAFRMAGKGPLQSKKFIAYIIAQVLWSVTMILMIYKWQEKTLMVGMVAASCVLQIVYLAGQARIDLDLSKGKVEIETDDDEDTV